MNILFVAHEIKIGGATRSLLGVIDELLAKDYKVFVLVPRKKGELIDELKTKDVTIIPGRYYSWIGKPSRTFKVKQFIKNILNYLFIVNVAKKIKLYNIDVIHTNSLVTNIGGYLKKKINVPHVWHIREFGKEDHGFIYSMSEKKTVKFIDENSDKIIVISKALLKKYQHFISDKKLHLIYNGIPKSYIQKKTFTRKIGTKKHINLLISGAIKEGKGQDQAILASKVLINKGIKNFTLNIAGRGNPSYINKMQELVEENNLTDYVKFHGFIENVNSLRRNMDVELVCSKSEAFGRVTIEAMMSMNPVIASNTGANTELIKEDYNGLLYNYGNYVDLANKIEVLIQNPDLLEKYGKNGYKFALENFTAEINAKNIEMVYKELISHNIVRSST